VFDWETVCDTELCLIGRQYATLDHKLNTNKRTDGNINMRRKGIRKGRKIPVVTE
jgi:hypothetical protein